MPPPFLTVVRGDGRPEEIAALVAVLAAAAAARPGGGAARQPRPAWNDRSAQVRGPLRHGPDAWRLSARRGLS